jgi:hypothetical protein
VVDGDQWMGLHQQRVHTSPPLTWDTLEIDAIWIVSEIDKRKDEDLDTMEEDENVMEEDYSMIDDL